MDHLKAKMSLEKILNSHEVSIDYDILSKILSDPKFSYLSKELLELSESENKEYGGYFIYSPYYGVIGAMVFKGNSTSMSFPVITSINHPYYRALENVLTKYNFKGPFQLIPFHTHPYSIAIPSQIDLRTANEISKWYPYNIVVGRDGISVYNPNGIVNKIPFENQTYISYLTNNTGLSNHYNSTTI